MTKINTTILVLYPNSLGLGYAIFDSPKKLVDYGIGYIKPLSNSKTLTRVKEYIEYYKPDIILVREVTKQNSKKMRRIEKLTESICRQVRLQGLHVHCYNRSQIQDVFAQFGISTKYQISQKIIEWYPELKRIELAPRKIWQGQNHNTGVFDAIALGLTYFYLE